MVLSCVNDTCKKLRDLLADACSRCTANTISLSGGLDSTIIASLLKERKPSGIAVIASDFVATDLTYCQAASKALDVPLFIKHAGTTEILNAVEDTIKILGNFNDIEIRNTVVIYLAIKWAKEQNLDGIITGDGADELFAGYDFLQDKSQDELEKELDRICRIMHFPAQAIGKRFGIKIESPFLDASMVEFARTLDSGLKVRRENGKTYGKWILRKTFEDIIPEPITWRKKSPMQDGAGTAGLTGLFDSIVSDESFEEKKAQIQKNDGVSVRTKESLHYYEIYRKTHDIPKGTDRKCRYCKFGLGSSMFCRMCGAFPA